MSKFTNYGDICRGDGKCYFADEWLEPVPLCCFHPIRHKIILKYLLHESKTCSIITGCWTTCEMVSLKDKINYLHNVWYGIVDLCILEGASEGPLVHASLLQAGLLWSAQGLLQFRSENLQGWRCQTWPEAWASAWQLLMTLSLISRRDFPFCNLIFALCTSESSLSQSSLSWPIR